ncbi:Ankyrin repeat-containing domain protein [Lactarius tabidus]
MNFEAVQILLEHNADINSQNIHGDIPLYWVVSGCGFKGNFHGADPNICNNNHTTPLHEASSHGLLEASPLLLSYRAKVDDKDGEGKTPLQRAASEDTTN